MDAPVGGDKKLRNLLIGAIKRVWHRHPNRIAVVKRVRIEESKTLKDGSQAAKPAVFYLCEQCGAKCKPQPHKDFPQIQIDHRDPIVPVGKTYSDLTWDEYLSRVFCPVENLDALCANCHRAKSKVEVAGRVESRK